MLLNVQFFLNKKKRPYYGFSQNKSQFFGDQNEKRYIQFNGESNNMGVYQIEGRRTERETE